jgi:hypothetical protein
MKSNTVSDLVLSNGAEVNFKVAKDASGAPVVSYLQISFPERNQVPQGGISSAVLRELTIGQLLATWFSESSRSFLDNKSEDCLWDYIKSASTPSGRSGHPEIYYAGLAYFYVQQIKVSPTRPTATLANHLQVSPKTISTRLAQARKLEVLTSNPSKTSQVRAGGELTAYGKRLIMEFLKGE